MASPIADGLVSVGQLLQIGPVSAALVLLAGHHGVMQVALRWRTIGVLVVLKENKRAPDLHRIRGRGIWLEYHFVDDHANRRRAAGSGLTAEGDGQHGSPGKG